jgi:flagellar basal body rod protein FlgB
MQNDGNDVNPDHEVLASAENALLYNAYAALARGHNKLMATATAASP